MFVFVCVMCVQGGGLWMDGPLVSTAVGSCAPVLTNTLFQGNAVQQAGGAVAITNIASTTTIQLTGCSFTNNTVSVLDVITCCHRYVALLLIICS